MASHPRPDEQPAIARYIWEQKYRLAGVEGRPDERRIEEMWRRVATAVAAVERTDTERQKWAAEFHEALCDLTILPAGRILAGAGSAREVTLFNCFVMGRIEDDLASIFENVKEAALTLQRGGGIGHDFSTLRPRGARVASTGTEASGPTSFMDVWDAMCRTIVSAGQRRGAMMATMRCDHPDIEDFIAAKADPRRLRNFNLSVLVTDRFLAAVRGDEPFDLVFEGTVHRTVRARDVWDRLMRATYEYAEPGVIFIDRINALNTLGYCETIHATNPCGEQPLPPYGACLLGSINLARLVSDPFGQNARLDESLLASRVRLLVRFLDNVIDASRYPLAAQEREARDKRRIGVGVTGLADALVMTGLRYGSEAAVRQTERWMSIIEHIAASASAGLAEERGPFPLFDRERVLERPMIRRLPGYIREQIARTGLRNGCLTSIAPTGTISLLAGNVSSGIEPVFDLKYRRRLLQADGRMEDVWVEDYAHALYRARFGPDAPLTPAFVTTAELTPADHLAMQAAAQRHVDSSISKTINCSADIPFDAFRDIYLEADRLGLKGCTTFRPNAVTGSVLVSGADAEAEPPEPIEARPTKGGAGDVLDEPCAQCGTAVMQRSEGCWTCPICGLGRCS